MVAAGKLTFTGPVRLEYELDANGNIKVNRDGSITVAAWPRDSEGSWKPWMNNMFTKVT